MSCPSAHAARLSRSDPLASVAISSPDPQASSTACCNTPELAITRLATSTASPSRHRNSMMLSKRVLACSYRLCRSRPMRKPGAVYSPAFVSSRLIKTLLNNLGLRRRGRGVVVSSTFARMAKKKAAGKKKKGAGAGKKKTTTSVTKAKTPPEDPPPGPLDPHAENCQCETCLKKISAVELSVVFVGDARAASNFTSKVYDWVSLFTIAEDIALRQVCILSDLLLFGREEDARSESNALRLDDTLNDIGIAGASEASPTKATLWVHQAPPQRQRSYYDLGFLLCGCC
eukprot:m.233979 g.233979  ORF g.233979 m.233979 type:complete len:287 (+) comp18911_c0_seq3:588-1448(+)